MNPQTGELFALASSPGFDPNLFMPLGDSQERQQLLSDPNLPLYNRTIQALYPPGSTFKIITSLAALESGSFDPDKKVFCDGSYTLGTRIFHCWKPHGHGMVDFINAVAESCDVYFYQVGSDLGPEAIEEMAKHFGLGATTGVDLPHEKKWDLPMAQKLKHGQHWQGGDTLNYAIGQGALQVTPLQMANLVSMFANGGKPVAAVPRLRIPKRFGQFIEHLRWSAHGEPYCDFAALPGRSCMRGSCRWWQRGTGVGCAESRRYRCGRQNRHRANAQRKRPRLVRRLRAGGKSARVLLRRR